MLSILEVVPFYIGRLILMTFNNILVILTFASIDTGMQDALSAFFFLHLSLQSTYSLH